MKLAISAKDNREPGVLVPMPTNPLGFMVSAEYVEVAVAVEVAIKRLLLIERKVQAFDAAEPSVSASCGVREPAIVSP